MSAYALPGSLFPPLGGTCSSYDRQINVSTPLNSFSKEKKGNIGHFSFDPILSVTKEELNDVKEEQREEPCPTEVGIEVKKAKIDPVRLIQAVTTVGNKRSGNANQRSRMKNRDLNESHCAPHEDAILFELSISFNGRSYSATRTLPRIMELRNDLIRELNSRRKRLRSSRRMRWNSKTRVDDDDTVATVDDQEDWDVFIPEIPGCDTDSVAVSGGGVAGRGFAMLQALLGPYCPAIERWLRNVVDLVPPTSSPSLSNFLWEPVSVDIGSRCGVMRTSSSLECIVEDDGCDDETDCIDGSEEETGNDVSSVNEYTC